MLNTLLCVMAATLAVNTIFVFSLLTSLTGEQRAMFVFATALLAGGLFFTVRTMRRLSNCATTEGGGSNFCKFAGRPRPPVALLNKPR
jgi:hypothetical protein